jgi:hypothetical protein
MGAGRGLGCVLAGTLVAAHAADRFGLSVIMWLSAAALLALPLAAKFLPAFPEGSAGQPRHQKRPERPWLLLLRQRAFERVTLVGALVLGSHAMYDSFAVIRWREAGISPATIGLLWSESVAAEVAGATPRRLLVSSRSSGARLTPQRWSFPYCRSRRASYSPQAAQAHLHCQG